MNNSYELKGVYKYRENKQSGYGMKELNGNISVMRLREILKTLEVILKYWEEDKYIEGALINVKYVRMIPKSKRIKRLFCDDNLYSNDTIVGAKYDEQNKHVMTHYISMDGLKEEIESIKEIISICEKEYSIVTSEIIKSNLKWITSETGISQTYFKEIITDISYIEEIYIERNYIESENTQVVTLYKTNNDISEILRKLDIHISPNRIIGSTTIRLFKEDYNKLINKAPYLVAMTTTDFNELDYEDFKKEEHENNVEIEIKAPENEPIIGVIDTLFDERVYFSDWVESVNIFNEDIEINPNDLKHGTAVSSIIVDGPRWNTWLEDGCGNFRVKHFGVSLSDGFDSFAITLKIKEIVEENLHIKVWNLSLGSHEEIHKNFISLEGSILDELQFKYDIIFVVAGTNNQTQYERKIGAPADSINSLVVNSVDKDGEEASYSRKGVVLSFFRKPDISYYGGCSKQYINVWINDLGPVMRAGTSFAAPWITRKLGYLIYKLGLPIEVAKSLIVDASIGWKLDKDEKYYEKIGYGICPIHIDNIIKSKNEEVKLLLYGKTDQYTTYNYNLPIPSEEGLYNYIVKATLSYMPSATRTQGIDYTNTDINFRFGRIDSNNKIKPISKNNQTVPGYYTNELQARTEFRKWDSVKFISNKNISGNNNKISDFGTGKWGLELTTFSRLTQKDRELNFGIVLTLAHLEGKNTITDVVNLLRTSGWIVNEVNIENRIELEKSLEAEVQFEL